MMILLNILAHQHIPNLLLHHGTFLGLGVQLGGELLHFLLEGYAIGFFGFAPS